MSPQANFRILLLLGALMLSACARTPLSPWQSVLTTAQFSIRILPQAEDMPLQGGIQIGPEGGRLGLITQYGRTVSQCIFTPDSENGTAGMVLHCETAPGMGVYGVTLANRVALAVYRALCAPPSQGLDWSLRGTSQRVLQFVEYEDRLGKIHIHFTEVRNP